MRKIFTFIIMILVALQGFSQGRAISGTVKDQQGNTLPGVTVLVVGTQTGTVTDMNGRYSLNTDQGTLRFSYIGYTTQEVQIGNQSTVNVTLVEELTELNEVVVIGYGTQLKRDVSTSVVTVGDEDIANRPIVSAPQALQGKAAGVQVIQNSGEPGGGMTVRVRGATSVTLSNDPLYVVDGVPMTSLNGINPNDVASMTVLKDATSAAIYGARGANGVVIVTTKRGVENKPVISFNTYFGTSQLTNTIDVLTTKQYRDLMEEISPGLINDSDTTMLDNNDWNEEVFKTGYTQSYQLAFSGGDDKNRYYVSGNYLSEKGIIRPAKFDRYSVRLNLDNELRSWIKLNTSLTVSQQNTKDTPDNLSSGRGGVIMSTLNTPPFLQTWSSDTENEKGWYDPNPFQQSWENPAAYMDAADQNAVNRQIVGNIGAEVKIIEGLTYRPRIGVDLGVFQSDYFLDPISTGYGRQQNGTANADKSNNFHWLFDQTLEYAKKIGEHNFTALVGNSIEKNRWDQSYMSGNDFPPDYNVRTLWAANTISAGSDIREWALASFIGRITYNYAGKYYLLANFRRDGTSRVANLWGNFPSVSAAWRISAEPFMQGATWIDDLKLRAGWGLTGNSEGIYEYASYGTIGFTRVTPTNPLSGPAVYQTSYQNPDLRWEVTNQSNIGIDFTTLGGRLTLTADAYIKRTKDVILPVQLTSSLPITSLQTNAGEIENRGIEFKINSINMDKTFKWSTDFNIAFNDNEVISLQYTRKYARSFGFVYSNNEYAIVLEEGVGLGSFYGYVSEGVDPETGDIIYSDLNGDGEIGPADRTIIGSGMPDFIFGLTNTFNYKKFDFSFFLQGSYGNEIYNSTRVDLEGMFDSKNQSVDVLRRWTPDNQYTDIPRAGNTDNIRNSTRFVEDGSYMRLKSVTLSYRLFENHKYFKLLSVYVTGQNLLTFTKYKGFDPEVSQYGNSAIASGFDYGTYPQSRTFMVGLNVEF